MQNILIGQRYRLAEKIGSGGMADVYKAVDETLGRNVAVKVMHARLASDPNFTARFQQEAKAAANLQSPYIVNIYDWGSETGANGQPLYYIVMEYVRGTDLKSVIRQYGALPSKQVAEIGAQVCSALTVAHGYDIIHRDVKPHNIMILGDGSVKVMDFGIARAGNTTMTQTGSVLGSAHYVSPEQAQGRDLTAASDLYSLGVVLYEAATGKMPFDGDSPVATALKQVQEQAVRPTTINPDIDPQLEQVIGYAMAKDPRARYGTADAMRRDLLRVARGEAIVGAHGGEDDATRMMGAAVGGAAAGAALAGGRRGPADVDTTTVMPAVDGAAGAGGLGDAAGAAAGYRTIDAEPPKNNKKIWIWVAVGAIVLIAAGVLAWQLGLFNPGPPTMPNVTNMPQELALQKLFSEGIAVGGEATGATKLNPETNKLITIVEEYSPLPAGHVVSTDPEEGVELVEPENTEVTLTISLGEQEFDVPDLTGKTLEEAAALLADGNFVLEHTTANSSEVAADRIISQDPEPGTKLIGGSTINVVVSLGIENVGVPDVVGFTQEKAVAEIEGAGFRANVSTAFNNDVRSGVVISQNPKKGASLPVGGTVDIVVSKGAEQVTVPNVSNGNTFIDAARAKLEAAGLVVQTRGAIGELDLVLGQSPAANTKVPRGSTVTLTVGDGN